MMRNKNLATNQLLNKNTRNADSSDLVLFAWGNLSFIAPLNLGSLSAPTRSIMRLLARMT